MAQDKLCARLQPIETIPIRARIFPAENADGPIQLHIILLSVPASLDNSNVISERAAATL